MGDVLPQTPPGITVSVADKVDSLVGLIGAGCAPTASADPSGLRRIANGLLQVILCTTMGCHVHMLPVSFVRHALATLGEYHLLLPYAFSGCNPSLIN